MALLLSDLHLLYLQHWIFGSVPLLTCSKIDQYNRHFEQFVQSKGTVHYFVVVNQSNPLLLNPLFSLQETCLLSNFSTRSSQYHRNLWKLNKSQRVFRFQSIAFETMEIKEMSNQLDPPIDSTYFLRDFSFSKAMLFLFSLFLYPVEHLNNATSEVKRTDFELTIWIHSNKKTFSKSTVSTSIPFNWKQVLLFQMFWFEENEHLVTSQHLSNRQTYLFLPSFTALLKNPLQPKQARTP